MSQSRTLLLIDDEDSCAAILEMALSGMQHVEVTRVTSAEAGLDVFSRGNVAAVVTDLELPGMSGFDLLAAVSNVPVVIVSASPDPEAEIRALAAGASAFFPKPFSPHEIRRKMEDLLREPFNA